MAEANPDAYRDELGKAGQARSGATCWPPTARPPTSTSTRTLGPSSTASPLRVSARWSSTSVITLLDYWAIVLRRIDRAARPAVRHRAHRHAPVARGRRRVSRTTRRCSATSTSRSRLRPSSRRATSPRSATSRGGSPRPSRRPRTCATCDAISKRPSRRRRHRRRFTGWLEEILADRPRSDPSSSLRRRPKAQASTRPQTRRHGPTGPSTTTGWRGPPSPSRGLRGLSLPPGPAESCCAGMGGAGPSFEDWLRPARALSDSTASS